MKCKILGLPEINEKYSKQTKGNCLFWFTSKGSYSTNYLEQAGAELCQAQVKLEVIVDVVEEAWS